MNNSMDNLSAGHAAVAPPAPFGPIPSSRQLQWHALEFYGFVHFTVNTFTGKEWGYGDESPDLFNPTAFDADQIAETAANGGMRGLVLTCKHHDGFCLWPSRFTDHSVRNSAWRKGRGDVVRDLSEACARAGLLFGVYLSPWDRNHARYGHPEYLPYYRDQLRELLTQYGELFEVWFDGANGGDGYYGGAREKRAIDNRTYYDWETTWQLVRDLQPQAVMFSDGGPDIRWVGNERGVAGDPCWATINGKEDLPGHADIAKLTSGERSGNVWRPAECDVSIRPGWFYHAAEDDKVRTPENLLDLFFQSVGRGASLHLNLPPDTRGLIHENDVAALKAFRARLDRILAGNLAHAARATANQARGDSVHYGAGCAVDGRKDTFWCTDDGVLSPELVLAFPAPVTIGLVSLREHLPLGQRIDAFALDVWRNGAWEQAAEGNSIGNRRLVRLEPTATERLRLRIVKAAACPAIEEVAVYAAGA